MLSQPLCGMLADRFGRKPMLLLFGFGGMIVSVPVFSALAVATDPVLAFGIILIPLLLLSAYTSISALVKAELFPAHIRALGVALALCDRQRSIWRHRGICCAVVQAREGIEAGFYWYVTAIIGAATIAFLMLPETKKTSLILED